MLIDIKTGKKIDKKSKAEPILDRLGRPITRPEVVAEYKRIKSIPHQKRTAREGIRLNNILKFGDGCPNKNIMRKIHNPKPKTPIAGPTLAELNHIPSTPDTEPAQVIDNVIDSIYNGINPIQAMKDNSVSPQKFYRLIEKPCFSQQKIDYLHARECYAEFCLYKRELLEQQLIAGEIDSATYNVLSNDYKFLASKFYPKVYGDKINIESTSATTVTHTIDNERILQLNQMLSGGLLEHKPAIDVEFEEMDK